MLHILKPVWLTLDLVRPSYVRTQASDLMVMTDGEGQTVAVSDFVPSQESLAARLHARFYRPLMSFFVRRIGDRAAAEDLTQDVFVKLLGAADKDRIDDIDAFVFRVAGNLLKDRGRKAQRRGQAQLIEFDMAPVSDLSQEFMEDRDAERVLLARESVGQVLAALDELGQRTKDIYILFRLEGMKHKEIAVAYGIGRSTVEKEVMKATLHLARRFGVKA